LYVVGGAQAELILMNEIPVFFFAVGDVLHRRPTQVVVKATEAGLFVECDAKARREQSQRHFRQQRHDHETGYDRGKSKQNRFQDYLLGTLSSTREAILRVAMIIVLCVRSYSARRSSSGETANDLARTESPKLLIPKPNTSYAFSVSGRAGLG